VRRNLLAFVALSAAAAALSGCGWLHAAGVSHVKPSGFVLRGYASVAGAAAGQAGAACQTPAAGVAAGDPVLVTDPPGHTIATGALGVGVLARDGEVYRCDFPFEISGVPGGHQAYQVSVAGRPPVTFAATDLREDKPAVISVP
jgi:hypothetical protein